MFVNVIKRGDAGSLGVPLKIGPDLAHLADVTEDDLPLFHCIEFTIGGVIRKMWPDEVTFSGGRFHVPYTQEESFELEEKTTYPVDVRVHFETNGAAPQVAGTKIRNRVKVVGSNSEEVLT